MSRVPTREEREMCPCGHEWRRHDPQTGECDAPAVAGIGPCPCGRVLDFHQHENALRSRRSLSAAKEEGGA